MRMRRRSNFVQEMQQLYFDFQQFNSTHDLYSWFHTFILAGLGPLIPICFSSWSLDASALRKSDVF